MFEGLAKTQSQIAQQLSSLVAEGNFPCSSLFFGPSFSGRMYAASALATELKIPKDNTIIVSDRNHGYRIQTAISLLRRAKNNAAKKFVKENIGILLQQYHGALMEEQTATAKKRFEDASKLWELLEGLDAAQDKALDALTEQIAKQAMALVDANKSGVISVAQVRAIRDWCATSDMDGQKKLIVIEGLENALPSAVNALLKTLEEPPRDSYFVIISANPGRLLATILSRVRKFKFDALGKDQTRYILTSLFVDPNKYENLEEFFLSGAGIDDARLKKDAHSLVMQKSLEVPSLVTELEKNKAWDLFFKHVVEELYKGEESGAIEARKAEYLIGEINTMLTKAKTFNQLKRLTFDFVIYRVKEVLW